MKSAEVPSGRGHHPENSPTGSFNCGPLKPQWKDRNAFVKLCTMCPVLLTVT